MEHAIKKIYEGEPKLLEAFKKNQLPNGWLAVRNRVRAEQAKDDGGQHTIDRVTFELWCREAAVSDSVEVILGFLHDTGVLFYRPAYFLGQIILNQAWAIEAVYRVFDKDNKYIYEALEEQEGLLDYYMMCTVWEEHTDKERSLFVDFMLSCELCFETTPKDKDRYRRHRKLSERTFVVPQYLPAKMPQKLKNDFTAVLELTESKKIPYHFLPKVFMHRFIVQEQDLMPDEVNRYQEDLLLKYQDAYALVSADFQERSISIRYNPNNLDFPAFIEARLDEIAQEATFKAVKGKREEKASLGNMLLQYRQKEGRNPEGDVAKTEIKPTKPPAKQLFLSYSLQDKTLFDELGKQLEILKNVGLIRTWDESDILASEKWGEVNRHKLEEADIVVLLVSSDFLADKSKWESDVLRAMQRHEKGEAKVVPVIVRPCMWEYAPFKSLKALPRSHPSVTQAPNQDEAWREVAQEIRALLE